MADLVINLRIIHAAPQMIREAAKTEVGIFCAFGETAKIAAIQPALGVSAKKLDRRP